MTMTDSNNDTNQARRRAPGARRLGAESHRWRHEAERFCGLPAGMTAAHKLLAIVKAAAPALGLNGTDERLIDKLFQYTRAIDWTQPSRPIVAVSNEVLCLDLALSRSAIQRALRRLQEHGLIVMKDSPTGQRYFRRHEATGAIVAGKSFGIDLAILAVRHGELAGLAESHKRERLARREARRRAIIAARMLAQCVETADEEGLWTPQWERLETEGRALHGQIAGAELRHDREALAARLEALAAEARTALAVAFERPSEVVETRSAGRVSATPITYTDGFEIDSVSAEQEGSSCGDRQHLQSRTRSQVRENGTPHTPARISAGEVAALVPELRLLAGPEPTWADLGQACETLRVDFGIGHRLWDRAFDALGMPRRIIAFADMLTYADDHFAKGRGAYFAGMVKLAEAGRLNLGSSLYGMRARGGPDKPLAARNARVRDRVCSRPLGDTLLNLMRGRQDRAHDHCADPVRPEALAP